jgi:uncharacterized protein (DUF1501 family)
VVDRELTRILNSKITRKHIRKGTLMDRRSFIKSTAGFAGSAGLLPYARLAHAAGPYDDYKALVCLFMYGGNDSHNTIIPLGTEYAGYKTARSTLAMSNSTDVAADVATNSIFTRPLNAIAPSNTPGRSFALHTSLKKTAVLFNAGKVAVVSNVGPMVQPITKAQFANGATPVPPQLFSHSDQQAYWQSLNTDLSISGWGGRMADVMAAGSVNGTSPLSIGISLAGSAPFLRANQAVPYSLSPSGPIKINSYRSWDNWNATRPNPQAIFDEQVIIARTNKFEDAYGDVLARSVDTEAYISTRLEVVPTYRADFPGTAADGTIADATKPGLAPRVGNVTNQLADQLRMVARMIKARSTMGAKRQIYFVSIGGFDNHGAEYEKHAKLLASIDDAVAAFQAKMEANSDGTNVTLFTASDFGRTLRSNGEGSDHGWGSHHFVVGGAVQGGKFYGTSTSVFPEVTMGTITDVGQGRLLPTISSDEYAATLGTWFGLSKSELEGVLPNLSKFQQFTNYKIGFLG